MQNETLVSQSEQKVSYPLNQYNDTEILEQGPVQLQYDSYLDKMQYNWKVQNEMAQDQLKKIKFTQEVEKINQQAQIQKKSIMTRELCNFFLSNQKNKQPQQFSDKILNVQNLYSEFRNGQLQMKSFNNQLKQVKETIMEKQQQLIEKIKELKDQPTLNKTNENNNNNISNNNINNNYISSNNNIIPASTIINNNSKNEKSNQILNKPEDNHGNQQKESSQEKAGLNNFQLGLIKEQCKRFNKKSQNELYLKKFQERNKDGQLSLKALSNQDKQFIQNVKGDGKFVDLRENILPIQSKKYKFYLFKQEDHKQSSLNSISNTTNLPHLQHLNAGILQKSPTKRVSPKNTLNVTDLNCSSSKKYLNLLVCVNNENISDKREMISKGQRSKSVFSQQTTQLTPINSTKLLQLETIEADMNKSIRKKNKSFIKQQRKLLQYEEDQIYNIRDEKNLENINSSFIINQGINSKNRGQNRTPQPLPRLNYSEYYQLIEKKCDQLKNKFTQRINYYKNKNKHTLNHSSNQQITPTFISSVATIAEEDKKKRDKKILKEESEETDFIANYLKTVEDNGVVEDQQLEKLQKKIQYLVDNKPLLIKNSNQSWQQEVLDLIYQTKQYSKFNNLIKKCALEYDNSLAVKNNIQNYLVTLNDKQKCLSELIDVLQEISAHDPHIWQQMLEYKIDDSVFWAQEKQQLISDYNERRVKLEHLINNTHNLKKIAKTHIKKQKYWQK